MNSDRLLRILAIGAVAATLAWSAWWVVGWRALHHGIDTGLARLPQVQIAGYSINGFPSRFDITFDQPRITTPELDWSAPFVQVFALSYRLNHLIAVFAHDQQWRAAGHLATLHSSDLRASAVFAPGLDLALQRVTVIGQALDLALDGNRHQADGLRLASRRIAPAIHQLAIEADTVIPDPAMMQRLDPQGVWPRQFDTLRLAAEAEFDRPLDRHLLQGAAPRLNRLTLTDAEARYGATDIRLSGRLTPDDTGLVSGDLRVAITGWRDVLRRAVLAGVFPARPDSLIQRALRGLVSPENPDRLEASLVVTNGVVRIGPLQIGQIAPLF